MYIPVAIVRVRLEGAGAPLLDIVTMEIVLLTENAVIVVANLVLRVLCNVVGRVQQRIVIAAVKNALLASQGLFAMIVVMVMTNLVIVVVVVPLKEVETRVMRILQNVMGGWTLLTAVIVRTVLNAIQHHIEKSPHQILVIPTQMFNYLVANVFGWNVLEQIAHILFVERTYNEG